MLDKFLKELNNKNNTIIFFIVSVLSCGVIIYGFINIPYEKGNKT